MSRAKPFLAGLREDYKYVLIWLHGLGDSGESYIDIVEELGLKDLPIKFILPNAEVKPVTINNGYPMPAWYDIKEVDLEARQDADGIEQSAQYINSLIAQEVEAGVASEQIILAGFSQGAALAMYTALRHPKKLLAVVAVSGYLPLQSMLTKQNITANQTTPMLIAHGLTDDVVPIWGAKKTQECLQQLNIPTKELTYPIGHEMSAEEIFDIGNWLREKILFKQ